MIHSLIIENWQRKIISLLLAIIIWFLINHSLTMTKTISNIPVRVVNLPANKTIEGLTPNGILEKRASLTITGIKDVLSELNGNNLQIVVDAEGKEDQWIAKVDKKSLISLSSDIDISHAISEVAQNSFVIRLSPLVTEKIPITILQPTGEPPPGYQFVDIWPRGLFQTVSGTEEQVKALMEKGIEFSIDLSKIPSSELDLLQQDSASSELCFQLPDTWKTVLEGESINDPAAANLSINFLHHSLLPLDPHFPISLYFPLQTSGEINPKTYSLTPSSAVEEMNGLFTLKIPLFVKGVSHSFLDIVKGNVQLVIQATAKEARKSLPWSVQFVNPQDLENIYVAQGMSTSSSRFPTPLQEAYLRSRFRAYMRAFALYTGDDHELKLDIRYDGSTIIVEQAT